MRILGKKLVTLVRSAVGGEYDDQGLFVTDSETEYIIPMSIQPWEIGASSFQVLPEGDRERDWRVGLTYESIVSLSVMNANQPDHILTVESYPIKDSEGVITGTQSTEKRFEVRAANYLPGRLAHFEVLLLLVSETSEFTTVDA